MTDELVSHLGDEFQRYRDRGLLFVDFVDAYQRGLIKSVKPSHREGKEATPPRIRAR